MLERLGPYRILQPLGQGGMSQVFVAVRYGASGFEKKVALKTLPADQLTHDRWTRALIQEAKLCAQLNHRNLVQVYDLGVDEGVYYLAMELVQGVDLKHLRPHQPLPVELALFIVQELALALDYVHGVTDADGRSLGLVHRDVSPSNILLSDAGEVKLSDFGIAKATLLTDATWGRFRKGTIAYMSPEQMEGVSLSAHSDQFSLGVVLYEMLSGFRPFDADTPVATIERIQEAKPPKLDHLPDDLHPLLLRMLSKQHHERFPTSRDVYEAIEALPYRRVSAFALADFLAAK
ncbi:MAG: serine/threonine protein kinase [Deltaproteobacteria bacterium]|nr:MAG: serine/threonine protein kinase [Deltaproteobacteria bacterium]